MENVDIIWLNLHFVWSCSYVKTPSTCKLKSLPYGKYMTGKDLQSDLQSLFKGYSVMAGKLITLGRTQNNECLNNAHSTKNPKTIFYSGSESTSFRVDAVVAQKKHRPSNNSMGLCMFPWHSKNSILIFFYMYAININKW